MRPRVVERPAHRASSQHNGSCPTSLPSPVEGCVLMSPCPCPVPQGTSHNLGAASPQGRSPTEGQGLASAASQHPPTFGSMSAMDYRPRRSSKCPEGGQGACMAAVGDSPASPAGSPGSTGDLGHIFRAEKSLPSEVGQAPRQIQWDFSGRANRGRSGAEALSSPGTNELWGSPPSCQHQTYMQELCSLQPGPHPGPSTLRCIRASQPLCLVVLVSGRPQ